MRLLIYLLVLAILGSLVFVIYTKAPRIPAAEQKESTSVAGVQMRIRSVFEETEAYRIEVRYPQFDIPAIDAAVSKKVNDALAEFKTYEPLPADSAAGRNEFIASFDSVYVGEDIVSVELLFSEYTGGAHPLTSIIAVNVERATGRELSLSDALALIGMSLEEVSERSLTELRARLGEEGMFPEGAAPTEEHYSTFLVSKDAVTFIFNAYQVAPYSAGPQEVSFERK